MCARVWVDVVVVCVGARVSGCTCVCVCVCERERERERESGADCRIKFSVLRASERERFR